MSRSSTSLVLAVVALLTALLAGAANGAPTNSSPSKQAIRALTLRGQALNQTYHLGQSAGPSKQAIRALTLRGQTLNQTYHLGQSAGRTGSSFAWVTVAFVAAAAFVLILVAFAGTVGVRRRRAVIAV
jgi:Flp pilus assembly protein TadB